MFIIFFCPIIIENIKTGESIKIKKRVKGIKVESINTEIAVVFKHIHIKKLVFILYLKKERKTPIAKQYIIPKLLNAICPITYIVGFAPNP
jgi:hypothetical protein